MIESRVKLIAIGKGVRMKRSLLQLQGEQKTAMKWMKKRAGLADWVAQEGGWSVTHAACHLT